MLQSLSGTPMTCHRCHKSIDYEVLFASVQMPPNGRGISQPSVNYHVLCLPPNLFHHYHAAKVMELPSSRLATGSRVATG